MENILNNLSGFAQEVQGLTMIGDGAALQVAGAELQAGVYRNAGIVSEQTAQYNIALNKLETERQMDVLSRTIRTTFASNAAVQAASGVGMGSKSYLAVQNRIRSNFERMVMQARTSSEQRNQVIDYEGKLAKVNFENRARAAEYQAEVAQWQADQQQSAGFADIFKQVASSFMLG